MLQIADNLQLPPEAMTLTSAVLGIRGSGKTNTAVVFTEELLDQRQQVIVIDPLDVWWGLKSSADGLAPGHAIAVFGGAHADLPLSGSDGAAIADLLVEHRTPAILSLRHLRKGESKRFVADFAEQLYQRKGESGLNTPLLVVIDEASSFVPQGVQGDVARMVGAIEDLVRRGRAAGIGVMLIDQRAASVNKDVLTQLELLVAHRHTSPQDRKALQLWVQAHDTGGQEKTFLASLASLELGEAWFWSPSWLNLFSRVKVRHRKTFDSSATPKLGEVIAAPVAAASVDLESLRALMAARIEEQEESDPKTLKARLTSLQKELDARPTREIEKRVEVPVLAQGEVESLRAQADGLISLSKELFHLGNSIVSQLNQLSAPAAPPVAAPEPERKLPPPPKPLTEAPPARAAPRKPQSAAVQLSPQQNKILTALIQYPAGLNRKQIGLLTHYSHSGGGLGSVLSELKALGWISGTASLYVVTEKGVSVRGAVGPRKSGEELRRAWIGDLNPCETAIFRELAAAHPAGLTRAELGAKTGYEASGGSFGSALKHLKDLALIEGEKALKIASILA